MCWFCIQGILQLILDIMSVSQVDVGEADMLQVQIWDKFGELSVTGVAKCSGQ